jgi:hypothetical protein
VRTARGFVKDESGMTLALAVIMIVLIGVMGAGLLTFTMKDLNTVVEENRGQRAFEVAEAGIGAAKRQLASSVVRDRYNDVLNTPPNPPTVVGTEDIQWSAAKGGWTLNNLDGDATTSDSANVKITYSGTPGDLNEKFTVVSTGTYGTAKRKIEAIFKGVAVGGSSGSGILGLPLYYTPSDVRIEKSITLKGISMFSQKNILIEGPYGPTDGTIASKRAYFSDDISTGGGNNDANGTFISGGGGGATPDALCNWYTLGPCFDDPGQWNTQPRTLNRPGLAAEGKICGFTTGSDIGTCDPTSVSIADGVYGYDCTTGTVVSSTVSSTAPPCPRDATEGARGNPPLTFVKKNPNPDGTTYPTNVPGTISFPFPLVKPNSRALAGHALRDPSNNQSECSLPDALPASKGCYFNGVPSPTAWTQLFPGTGNSDRVVFIDAHSSQITFDAGLNGSPSGVLVVWCGQLVQQQDFNGIILSLKGEGFTYTNTDDPNNPYTVQTSSCEPATQDEGTYINAGTRVGGGQGQTQRVTQKGWVFAQGGDGDTAGITLKNQSIVQPSQDDFSYLDDSFDIPTPPTSFALQSWRELYQ